MRFPALTLSVMALLLNGCAPSRAYAPRRAFADAIEQDSGRVPNVVIALERTRGYADCSATYRVLIREDGSVHFTGMENVTSLGEREWSIPRARVGAMLQRFRRLRPEVHETVSLDEPVTRIYARDGESVWRYEYPTGSAQPQLAALADYVNFAADTYAWVGSFGEECGGDLFSIWAWLSNLSPRIDPTGIR